MKEGMHELWQAVIFQMVSDASTNPKSKETIRIKREAIQWLNNEDGRNSLRYVCDLAGISYERFCDSYVRLRKAKVDEDRIKLDSSNKKNRFNNIKSKG